MEPLAPAPQMPENNEGGVSIVRTGEEAEMLRRRTDGPARIGRYFLGLLGAVTFSAGIADWIFAGSKIGLALGLFGSLLIILAVVQRYLYQRDRAHWPEQAILWKDGIELVLNNGEVRGTTWSDPDLAIDLVDRRAPPPAGREYLLIWMADSKIPPVQLSPEGFEQVNRATAGRPLRVTENRRGSRTEATRVIEIRQTPLGVLPDAGKAAAPNESG